MSASSSALGYAFEHAVVRAFEEEGWRVEAQPLIGHTQPDLVATSRDGTTVIAEIKATSRPVHVAMIAQVAAYRRAAQELPTFPHVEAALLVLGPVTAAAREAASQMDVAVITTEALEPGLDLPVTPADAERVAREWVRQISKIPVDEVADDDNLREALPEVALRHLATKYGLVETFAEPMRCDVYFDVLRSMSESLERLLGQKPAPRLLREVAAVALMQDAEFVGHLRSRVDPVSASSAEQLAKLAQAAAGALVASYLAETELGEQRNEKSETPG